MKLKVFLAAVILLITVGILGGIKWLQIRAMIDADQQGGPPPTAVDAAPVRSESWETALRSVGSVTATEGVVVRSEVAGIIERILFEPGGRTEAGRVIIELDRSIEEANLAQARADADLAERTLRRSRELFTSGVVPEASFDAAAAELAGIQARIASLEAVLRKKTIRAPFAGTLGIKQVNLGEYLEPGDAIVSLQAMDRVFVELSLPQRALAQLSPGLEVRTSVDAYPGVAFRGRLTAINPQIDPMSRNVRLQATFDNPTHQLRAGMFVDVEVVLPETRSVLVVPATAILHNSSSNTVYVVAKSEGPEATLLATQQIVRLGESRGDFVEITEGLTGDEQVVTAGAFKLYNGQEVVLSNLGSLSPSEDPTPADS